jgi:hypothetical protein
MEKKERKKRKENHHHHGRVEESYTNTMYKDLPN